MEEQNLLLTAGTRTRLASIVLLTQISVGNLVSNHEGSALLVVLMNHLPSHLSNPKPGHTTGGRVAAVHGRAAGQGGAGQDGTPTDWFAQETTVPRALQSIEDNCPGHLFGSTNKGNPM